MKPSLLKNTIHLAPGEFVSGCGGDKQVITVLGSCISLVLWHPPSLFYAMCHFVCVSNSQGRTMIQTPDGRYGDQILPYMLRLLQQRKLTVSDLQARLYGGAVSVQTSQLVPSFQVGRQNSAYALQFCQQHGITLCAQQVASEFSLKLKLHTSSGEVDVTPLHNGGHI